MTCWFEHFNATKPRSEEPNPLTILKTWLVGPKADGPVICLRMPGGGLAVEVSSELELTLRGPVQEVGRFVLSPVFLGMVRKVG